MKLLVVLFFTSASVLAQDPKQDAINSIFSNDFLEDYEEVTPPPLKDIGPLKRCGEGDQKDKFVCVPYFNCDPETNTVQQNPDKDGSTKIDIRFQDDEEPKCDHYLEVCCKLPEGGIDLTPEEPVTSPTRPTRPTEPSRPTRPTEPSRPTRPTQPTRPDNGTRPRPGAAFCGIRNTEGLDFNFVGGTNEANFGEFPWMVAILNKNPRSGQNLALCGGSLISPGVILTGAHCVQNVSVGAMKVRAGEWDTQTTNERIPYQERNVARKIIHPHFIRGNLYNDVALLILERPFTKADNLGTVCLPSQNQHFDSRECLATGWGKDSFGQAGRYAVILKKLQLPLVHLNDCQRALRRTRLGNKFVLHKSFICAGGEPNLDTCTGDGGSPLVCPDPTNPSRYLQVGIVAWGIGCGENQVPGVYVDVAHFRNWVDEKLLELGLNADSYSK